MPGGSATIEYLQGSTTRWELIRKIGSFLERLRNQNIGDETMTDRGETSLGDDLRPDIESRHRIFVMACALLSPAGLPRLPALNAPRASVHDSICFCKNSARWCWRFFHASTQGAGSWRTLSHCDSYHVRRRSPPSARALREWLADKVCAHGPGRCIHAARAPRAETACSAAEYRGIKACAKNQCIGSMPGQSSDHGCLEDLDCRGSSCAP